MLGYLSILIPANLNTKLAGKLVDYYIDCLQREPSLHDKVEFEIVFSCYSLDLPQRLSQMENHGFSKLDISEISASLHCLTNEILHPETGSRKADANKLITLKERRRK